MPIRHYHIAVARPYPHLFGHVCEKLLFLIAAMMKMGSRNRKYGDQGKGVLGRQTDCYLASWYTEGHQ